MRRNFILPVICSICCAQTPIGMPAPDSQSSSDLVVRITVNLVQVDASVTNSKGKPVADLKPEDFEVLQDGEPQKITNFSYVTAGIVPGAQKATQESGGGQLALPPPVLTPRKVQRVIALVVDDLGLSFESIADLHEALRRFVDEQMQPGDLVAIVRTSAGMGALQQFTNDKRRLHAAIDQMRYRFISRAGSYGFTPISNRNPLGSDPARDGMQPSRTSGVAEPSIVGDAPGLAANDLEACSLENATTIGSLGAVRFVVEGLGELPGRKALILFSENLKIFNNERCDYSHILSSLHKLTDATERAGVVIYTVDPRGIQPLQVTAADNPLHPDASPLAPPPDPQNRLSEEREDRRQDYFDSQQGLKYLAEETGGLFVSHNDIAGAVQDALSDSASYYLIGYHPSAQTFDPNIKDPKFHQIKVRLKRAGLNVRSRNGFFGFSGGFRESVPSTAAAQISYAMASPFAVSDMRVRLTALFSNAATPMVVGMLYIDGHDLTFRQGPDGAYRATLAAATFTFDIDGHVVSDTQKNYAIQIDPKGYDAALQSGFVLKVQHPVNPGAYQLRVVVRDEASQKIGSASQFIEVPDLKRGALTLSGILLKQDRPLEAGASANKSPEEEDPEGNEAVRIFKSRDKIRWTCEVFNLHKDREGRSNLSVQVRYFHDATKVYESGATVLQSSAGKDKDLVTVGGHTQLRSEFGPGNYILQVIVGDNLAKKNRLTSQSTDFEIKQ